MRIDIESAGKYDVPECHAEQRFGRIVIERVCTRVRIFVPAKTEMRTGIPGEVCESDVRDAREMRESTIVGGIASKTLNCEIGPVHFLFGVWNYLATSASCHILDFACVSYLAANVSQGSIRPYSRVPRIWRRFYSTIVVSTSLQTTMGPCVVDLVGYGTGELSLLSLVLLDIRSRDRLRLSSPHSKKSSASSL